MNMDSPSHHQRDMHPAPETHVSTAESRAEKRTARLDTDQRKSAPRGLKIVGIVVLIAAIAAAAYGILIRRSSDEHLAAWTNQQAVPAVEVVHPTTSTVPQHLVLPGDVAAFYEAAIYARVSGYLKSWSQDIGAHVHAGQLLATIETPDLDEELAQADADLATARANSALAELTAKRWHALISSNSVSVQSADEKQGDAVARRAIVAAQMAHVSRLQALEGFKRLVAPFDGIVTARNTDVGALINSGSNAPTPLFKVADMHEMRVYVRVPQAYASQLKTGMQATLTEPQYPGVTFPATLATTSVSVATDSRTVLTELMAPNPQGKLWPGTYAEVDFTLPADSNLLRVPSSALIFRSKGAQLATVTPDNVIALKDVTIGRNLGTVIEIKSGIAQGDRVVATPLDTIEDGEKVSVTETPAPPANVAQAAD
jgi:RND family efflux transporter MFP subunit